MENFKELVRTVVETGKKVNTPKGPTRRLLGATVRYDVRDTLPTVTAKKTNFKWALVEMAMFMKGVTDLSLLKEPSLFQILYSSWYLSNILLFLK